MSHSERAALLLVDRGVGVGMGAREAAHWRSVVADPCGCAEGLAGAVALGVAGAVLGPVTVGVLTGTGVGLVVGAVSGKIYGVARGLVLVRAQRRELRRRVMELDSSTTGRWQSNPARGSAACSDPVRE
jgi:hypothetical protein